MSLSFERWYPALFAIAAVALVLLSDFVLPADNRNELLSATISVGAILAGFLGTAQSILMALPPEGLPAKLRSSGYMDTLAGYMAESMGGSLLFCFVSIAGFFAVFNYHPLIFSALWSGLAIHAIASFWRVGSIMLTILRLDPSKL